MESKVEILEKCEKDEETMRQSEEILCKSIIRGLVKRVGKLKKLKID